jgi:hypothetical protein
MTATDTASKGDKPGESAGQRGRVEHHDSWSVHKKHRAVARMELSDAWEMRRSVMVIVLAILAIATTGLVYGVKKAWEWFR